MIKPANPYVGARALESADPIFGRDRARCDVLDLLVAERIVVLHSPSGAGKTSLIRAGLVPDLLEAGFTVLPLARLQWQGRRKDAGKEREEEYCLEFSLDSLPPEEIDAWDTEMPQTLEAAFSRAASSQLRMSEAYPSDQNRGKAPVVLIIDQFEELITTGRPDPARKREVLDLLAEVLRDPSRWLLLAMREDSLPALDSLIQRTRFRYAARYRLELLTSLEAKQAIEGPAAERGVKFAAATVDGEGTVEKLIGDLLSGAGSGSSASSWVGNDLVDPMQLQLVCFELWESLDEGTVEITLEDLHECADVDGTLMSFYDRVLAKVARAHLVSEKDLRAWFDKRLVTELDTRGMVFQGAEMTGGIPNVAVASLADEKLLRGEQRSGGTWYELPHDRWVRPVRRSNASFQQRASSSSRVWKEVAAGCVGVVVILASAVGFVQTSREDNSVVAAKIASLVAEARVGDSDEAAAQTANLTPLLLALLAYDQSPTAAADSALRAALRDPYPVGQLKLEAPARLAMFSPDSRYIVTIDSAGSLRVFTGSGIPMRQLPSIKGHAYSLAFTPDGRVMAVGSQEGRITLLGTNDWAKLHELRGGKGRVRALAFDGNGAVLAAASEEGPIRTFRAPDWREGPTVWDEGAAPANALAYSPLNPDLLVSAHHDSVVNVWLPRLNSPGPIKTLRGHSGYVYAVAFHPAGHVFATASKDRTIRVWQMKDWTQAVVLRSHSDNVNDVAFSRVPGSSLMISAGRDQLIELRATDPKWRRLAVVAEHTGPVRSARFDKSGKRFITAAEDSTVRIWATHGISCDSCSVDSLAVLAWRRIGPDRLGMDVPGARWPQVGRLGR